MKSKIFFLIAIFFFMAQPTFAQTISVQEKCFEQLKKNINEIDTFKYPLNEIERIIYRDLDQNFSRLYKGSSSFGIDLVSSDFEMRIFTFGRETSYQHPPFSPFPTYTLSEKWDEPAREYILAEEYVIDTQTGERLFLSCAFMQIISDDLADVTAERYLYDGAPLSLIRANDEELYRAWYSSNVSFDHNSEPFVTWKRLFIYPKETQNSYFNRYDVLTSFPGNSVTDFKILNPISFGTGTNAPDMTNFGVQFLDEDGKLIKSFGEPKLATVEFVEKNAIFGLNTYYQAIQDTFPIFAKKLAIRGVLLYDTVKEILVTKNNSEFSHIWESVLDPRELTHYAMLKENGLTEEDIFYEEQLLKISTLSYQTEAEQLLLKSKNMPNYSNKEQESVEDFQNIGNADDYQSQKNLHYAPMLTRITHNIIPIMVLIAICVLSGITFLFFRKKIKIQNNL